METPSIGALIEKAAPSAPRITPADIEANIAGEYFFTALDGVRQAYCLDGDVWHRSQPHDISAQALPLLTFCVLVLNNGFTVTGESACASLENFNAEIGRQIARKNATQKIWPLMGYELRTSLMRPVLTEADALADLNGDPRPRTKVTGKN